MASGLDLVKKAVDPGYYGGKIGAAFLASDAANIATSDSKAKALLQTLKSLVAFNLTGWSGMVVGGLLGVRTVVTALIRDSGSLEAGLKNLAKVQFYAKQLAPFTGGVAGARKELAALMALANRPFSLASLVAADRAVLALSRGAVGGAAAMKMLSDSAAKSGQDIEAVGGNFGSLVSDLQDGRPVAATADALVQMGVITQTTANHLEELQGHGAAVGAMLDVVQGDMLKAAGASEAASKSIEGLEARYAAAREALLKSVGEPFLRSEQAGIANTAKALENLAPVASAVAGPLSQVTTIGNNFTSWVAKTATSVPGLAAAANALTYSFMLLGGGAALGALVNVGKSLGPSILAMARSFLSGTAAAELETVAVQRLTEATLAQAAAAELGAAAAEAYAAGETALAVELGTAAAKAEAQAVAQAALGTSAAGASVAIGGMGTAMRAFLAATVLNPIFLLITGLTLLGGLILHNVSVMREQVKAAKDMADAGDEVVKSLQAQIDAMRNLDDQQQALLATTKALAKARADAAEVYLKRSQEKASEDQVTVAARNVRRLEGQQREIENAKGLAPSKAQRALNERIAHGEVDIRDAQFQQALASASPEEQQRMRAERTAENAVKIEQGKTLVSERTRVETAEEPIAANLNKARDTVAGLEEVLRKGKGTREARREIRRQLEDAKSDVGKYQQQYDQVRLSSPSEVIRGNAEVDRDEKAGTIGHDEAAARRVDLEKQRYDLEDHLDQRKQENQQMGADSVQVARTMNHSQIELDAEKEIAAIRARGMDAAEQEAAIRIGALQKELDTENYLGAQQRQALQNKIDGENKALELMRQQAAEQRAMDAAHLQIISLNQRATLATVQGRFGEAAKLRDQRIQAEDAVANRESYQQKVNSGQYSEAQARAAVAAEQASRVAGREAERKAFLETRGRELTEDELSHTSNQADRRRARSMRDTDKARERISEGLAANLSPEEAAAYAARAGRDDIHRDSMNAQRNIVADSLAAIGGGGGVATVDIGQEQRRTNELLASIREVLSKSDSPDQSVPLTFR